MDFKKEIEKLLKKHVDEVSMEIPKNNFGDYAFPCFNEAKRLKKNPNEIAKELSKKLKADFIEKVEVVGPYINFFVKKDVLVDEVVDKILKEKENYGKSKLGTEKVMVEFSQPNTHKAFHVGHIKGTAMGESLARILESIGNKVLRANYQGDTGMHVAKWLWCYTKYHSKETLRDDEEWIANIYVDSVRRLEENEELQEEVDEINRKLDSKEDKKLNELWKKTRQLSLDSFEKIYKELNTRFDNYLFESQVEERGKALAKELLNKKIAEISDGATIVNLKDQNLGVWVLLRKDGTALYSTKDLALAEEKFNKHKIDKAVHVVGKAQELHIYQLFKTLELMKFKQAKNCRYVPVCEVRFPWGKMSSRTGNNVLYSSFKRELVEYARQEILKRDKISEDELKKRSLAIAIACMKYSMLKQDPNKVTIFEKEKAMNFEGDTGPYLLYSYARASSILRKTKGSKAKITSMISEKEKELIKKLDELPARVKEAAENLDSSVIANCTYKLAQTFNEFYHNCQVIGSEEESFRLRLVEAFRATLKNSLNLLGINVIEEM